MVQEMMFKIPGFTDGSLLIPQKHTFFQPKQKRGCKNGNAMDDGGYGGRPSLRIALEPSGSWDLKAPLSFVPQQVVNTENDTLVSFSLQDVSCFLDT